MIPILSPVVFFGLNTLKSTTKSLAVDLSRLNTLGATGTKIVFFFNLLRVRKAPPPPPSFFLYGNPPGLVCLSKLHFLLGCWLVLKMLCCSNLHCVTLFCIYKRDNINSLHWPFSLWTYGYTKYCCLKSYHNKFDIFLQKLFCSCCQWVFLFLHGYHVVWIVVGLVITLSPPQPATPSSLGRPHTLMWVMLQWPPTYCRRS